MKKLLALGALALVALAVYAQTQLVDLNVSGTITTNDLTVSGTCMGCAGSGAAQTSGTFTVTWDDACTTSPTQVWDYVKIGDVVTLRMVGGLTCTSDSTSFATTGTDVPAAIRPITPIIARMGGVSVQDNGVVAEACLNIPFTGTMNFTLSDNAAVPCNAAAWTASGTKNVTSGSGPVMFTYLLIDPS